MSGRKSDGAAAPKPESEVSDLLGRQQSGRLEADLLSLLRAEPRNGAAASRLVDHLIAAGRAPEAVDVARAYLALREATPNRKLHLARLLLAKALAFTDQKEAAEVAPSAEELGDSLDAQLQRARLMLQLGRLDEANASCRLAGRAMPVPATPAQLAQLSKQLIRLARRAQEAGNSAITEECTAQVLDTHRLAERLSDHERAALLSIRARNLVALGRYAEAYSAMEEAATIAGDTQLESRALWIARYHGDSELLSRAWEQQRVREQRRLPSDLDSGLAAIKTGAVPPLSAIPRPMEVAWRVAALPDSEWPSWASRFLWGEAASRLLAWWLKYAGKDRQGQLTDLVCPVGDDQLRRLLDQGRGLIVASTHLGPSAALFPHLLSVTQQLAIVSGGKSQIDGVEGIVVPQRGRAGSIRAIREYLDQRATVAMAVDMVPRGADSRPLDIAGYSLLFSPLVARLSRSLSAPSVWIQPEWRDGKIGLRIEALPEPKEREDKHEWEARWFAAFSAHFTGFLRTCSPESASGIRVDRAEILESAARLGSKAPRVAETASAI